MRENLLEWLKDYTDNDTLEDIGGVSVVLDKLEAWENKEFGISSKSVSRYSVSYESGLTDDLKALIKPYISKKVGMM